MDYGYELLKQTAGSQIEPAVLHLAAECGLMRVSAAEPRVA